MSNPNPVLANFDPLRPLGTESLRSGPSVIKAIPFGILQLLGFDPTTLENFYSPIQQILTPGNPDTVQLQAWHDPTDDLAYATKRYADRRTQAITIDAVSGPNAYTATVAGPFAFDTNALYVVKNGGPTNAAGGTLLQVNALPAAQIVRMDGTGPLAAGEFLTLTYYVLAFDGLKLRIIGFIGGVLTQPLILAADPTVALGAASKQYTDAAVLPPTEAIQGSDVDMPQNVAVDLATLALVIPDDGPHLVHVEYLAWMESGAPNPTIGYVWVTDGTRIWATSTAYVNNVPGTSWGISGAGISLSFAASATPTLTLRAVAQQHITARTMAQDAGLAAGLPVAHIRATMIRTNA